MEIRQKKPSAIMVVQRKLLKKENQDRLVIINNVDTNLFMVVDFPIEMILI